jgi:hypothetical protein
MHVECYIFLRLLGSDRIGWRSSYSITWFIPSRSTQNVVGTRKYGFPEIEVGRPVAGNGGAIALIKCAIVSPTDDVALSKEGDPIPEVRSITLVVQVMR